MAPCDPSLNTVNPPAFPNFGFGFAPIQIPFPDLSIPTGLIEDLYALINSLSALFPSGTFKPTLDNFLKNILDAIANIISQIAPYLSFYNFILALLRLIVCIMEVLCAIPNPFAMASAVATMMSECVPPFLNLFPWLALIAMIIALLLLILALIEYIIATILAIILEIIEQLILLGNGFSFQDAESTIAVIQKIANLTCFMQNLLAIFLALAAIMAIIQALASFGGFGICDEGSDCCVDSVCPPFIKDSPITGTLGQLTYHSGIGTDVATLFASLAIPGIENILFVPPIRTEKWQLVDTSSSQVHTFSEVLTPVITTDAEGNINIGVFWPEGIVYNKDTVPTKAAYTCDLRLEMNPVTYIPTDTGGNRFFQIKDCVVVVKPYLGVLNFEEEIVFSNTTGTISLEGGLVYEDDGYTEVIGTDGYQASLNTFIHIDDLSISDPADLGSDDGVTFNNVEFTFKPGYATLAGHTLITVGCMPSPRIEKAVVNAVLQAEDARAVIDKLGPAPDGVKVPSTGVLPNVNGTLDCLTTALAAFRKNISIETAALFQAEVETCLGDLKDQTLAVYCNAIVAAVSQFKSEASVEPDVQFISRNINTHVVLKDASGTNICTSMPDTCVPLIESLIKANVTFGSITGFKYDGSSAFDATLTSSSAGSGTMTIQFNEKIFSTIVPPANGNGSSIEETIISYTFVDAPAEPVVRHDEGDVARTRE